MAEGRPSTARRRATARQRSIRRDLLQRILDPPEAEQIAAFGALREQLEAMPAQQKLDEQEERL